MNAFIRRSRLVMLEDVNISVLVERELGDERVPEPAGIQAAQEKELMEIHKEIRAAQAKEGSSLGNFPS